MHQYIKIKVRKSVKIFLKIPLLFLIVIENSLYNGLNATSHEQNFVYTADSYFETRNSSVYGKSGFSETSGLINYTLLTEDH